MKSGEKPVFLSVLISLLVGGVFVVQAGDWPTYRHDALRSSRSNENLSLPLHVKWIYKARKAPFPAWPPKGVLGKYSPLPAYDNCFQVVISGNRLLFGSSSENKLICLDAADGREVWSFLTDGPVRFAPNVQDGKVVFGSDDGRVRCLNLTDGSLVWEHHPVPGKIWLPGNNRMIYSVPIRTDVMVVNGKGYFGAGLFPETSLSMGVWRCSLNVSDGSSLSLSPSTRVAEGYLASDTGGIIHWPEGKLSYKSAAGFKFTEPWDGGVIRVGADTIRGTSGRINVSGTASWSAPVVGNPFCVAYANQKLFVSTDSGYLYCMAADSTAPANMVRPSAQPFQFLGTTSATQYASAAEDMLAAASLTQGYALIFDELGRGGLAYSLAAMSEMNVVCVVAGSAAAANLRSRFDQAGVHGKAVIVICSSAELPFPSHLFNIVAHDGFAAGAYYAGTYAAEAERVLRPYGGTSFIGPVPVRKEAVAGAGEWSHAYARPDRNPNSFDPYTGHTFRMQWFGRPGPHRAMDRHTRGMMPLWKNGILMVPGNHWVTAVDAYNGTVLWEKNIPLSTRSAHSFFTGHMALEDDVLYVLSGKNCLAFLPREGALQKTFSIPAQISGATDQWGYLASVGDLLVGSVNKRIPASYQGYSYHAEKTVHGRHEYYVHEISQALFAYGRENEAGAARWVYTPDSGAIINPTIVIADGRIMFVESTNPQTLQADTSAVSLPFLLGNGRSRLVALNVVDGSPAWKRSLNLSDIMFSAVMIHSDGKLFFQGTRPGIKDTLWGEDTSWGIMAYCTYAFNSRTGDSLWKVYPRDGIKNNGHGAGLRHPAVVNGRYYVLDQGGCLDINTGNPTSLNMSRMPGSCGTFTASATHFFGRSSMHSSTEIFPTTVYNYNRLTTTTRPSCWSNMIPAGGLLNMPDGQHGCSCDFSIQTSMAFLPTDKPLSTAYETKPLPTGGTGTLLSNFPNPFNVSTHILFSIPPQGVDVAYELNLYDSRGRRLNTLAQGLVGRRGLRSGKVVWSGTDGQSRGVASGIYYYRLSYGKKTISRSMLLVK